MTEFHDKLNVFEAIQYTGTEENTQTIKEFGARIQTIETWHELWVASHLTWIPLQINEWVAKTTIGYKIVSDAYTHEMCIETAGHPITNFACMELPPIIDGSDLYKVVSSSSNAAVAIFDSNFIQVTLPNGAFDTFSSDDAYNLGLMLIASAESVRQREVRSDNERFDTGAV